LNVFVSERPLRFDTVDRGTALRSSALRGKDPMKNLLTDISGVRVGHADDSALRRPLGVENLSAAEARVY